MMMIEVLVAMIIIDDDNINDCDDDNSDGCDVGSIQECS